MPDAEPASAESVGILAAGAGYYDVAGLFTAGKQGQNIIESEQHHHCSGQVFQELLTSNLYVEFLAQIVAYFAFPTTLPK